MDWPVALFNSWCKYNHLVPPNYHKAAQEIYVSGSCITWTIRLAQILPGGIPSAAGHDIWNVSSRQRLPQPGVQGHGAGWVTAPHPGFHQETPPGKGERALILHIYYVHSWNNMSFILEIYFKFVCFLHSNTYQCLHYDFFYSTQTVFI